MDKREIVDFAIGKLFSIFGKKNKERKYLIKTTCKCAQTYSDKFITYRERYKYASSYNIIGELTNISANCAIILQGPIREEDNFTLETVKLYKKEYPNIEVIVSTWDDTSNAIVDEIEKNGGTVILNKKPKNTGIGNINFQKVSTLAGINYANVKKCQYVLKTRTDQRICRNHFIEYFMSLIKQFPLDCSIKKQSERIITGPGLVDGTIFKPYMISDFMYFGNIRDVELIFSKELDESNMSVEEREKWILGLKGKTKISEFLNITAPELHMIRHFADNVMDKKSELTLKSYWEFVKKHLICLGWNDVNLYWPKYAIFNESRIDSTTNDKSDIITSYCWDFAEWLLIHNDTIAYKKEYEEYSQQIQL